MPQYLKMRYGGHRIRIWLAILHIFLTIVAQIAVSIRGTFVHLKKCSFTYIVAEVTLQNLKFA